MTVWLAGMRVTADRLNDYTPSAETTSGLVAATNFTVNSFFASRSPGGSVLVHCYLNYTGAGITATSGNISDTTLCTLPSGWFPPTVINAVWGDGSEDGECTIGTTGAVTLRSATATIPTGRNIRMTASWNAEP
ncbi:hypothetical protein [Streptomyces cylindrosporus]|uniref:Uncharacterized protein n=1 Tax=Streptomyces cylindrosporus TaxID=2927583 RepID=A0ABS9Y4M1_9ACTN|nr:hypothetical protein [Streptomyces cylindrosporus]MCI3272153.1 hypothetical protein [Streptomyces cylindrosporus]